MFYGNMFLALLFFCTSIFSADNTYIGTIPTIVISSPDVKRVSSKNKKRVILSEEKIKKIVCHRPHLLICSPQGSTRRIRNRDKLIIDIELNPIQEERRRGRFVSHFINKKKIDELSLLVRTLHAINWSLLSDKINIIEVNSMSSFALEELQSCLHELKKDEHIKELMGEYRIDILDDGSIEIRKCKEGKTWYNLKSYSNVIKIEEIPLPDLPLNQSLLSSDDSIEMEEDMMLNDLG